MPQEHRAEVYRIAESYYNIGVGDGAMTGASGGLVGEDKIEQFRDYLCRKTKEAASR